MIGFLDILVFSHVGGFRVCDDFGGICRFTILGLGRMFVCWYLAFGFGLD